MTSFQIPLIQTAALIENPGQDARVVIRSDVPVGDPGPHEILVKLAVSGVCKSEIRAFLGWGSYQPIVGHEGVGTVVKTGSQVSESLIGQRVGVKWLFSACGSCYACVEGFRNNCPNAINTGRNVPGTLQQYVVADSRYVTRIPDDLSSEVAAPLLCAGLTMAGAASNLDQRIATGAWVVISGAGGGLGHLGVQIASKLKGYRVIAVDSGQDKRDLSLKSGAEHFIDFAVDDVERRVKEITGNGAHAIIVASGSKKAIEVAPSLVHNMGLIITVGLPPNDFNLPIPAFLCAARALTVIGVTTGTEQEMEELLQQAVTGEITPSIEVLEFNEIFSIFKTLQKDGVTGRIVVRIPQ